MTALVRMRLAGFLQTGRAAAPLLAALVVLSILYGGGQAQAGEAYGVSAAILFGVLAWQTKILLDVEPDVQRRLGRVAVGPANETAAGVVAAVLAGLPVILVALVLPWLVGGVTTPGEGDPPLSVGVALGVWAHVLLLLPAVGLGALASRAVSGQAARGLAVLVGGVVLAIVLGLKNSPAPWLAPPLMTAARDTVGGADLPAVAVTTGWGVIWAAIAVAGYAWLRRGRP